jgi:hypothetical protein
MRLKEQDAVNKNSIHGKVYWYNSIEEIRHLPVVLLQMKLSIISQCIKL